MKIARPVVQRVEAEAPDVLASDCPMAAAQIASGIAGGVQQSHPLSLLRRAYGLTA